MNVNICKTVEEYEKAMKDKKCGACIAITKDVFDAITKPYYNTIFENKETEDIKDIQNFKYNTKRGEVFELSDKLYNEYIVNSNTSEIVKEVNHPEHYTQGEIECIDYIEDKDMNYRIGNAIKYLTRYRDKGTPVKDLEKAIWYINREIDKIKEV